MKQIVSIFIIFFSFLGYSQGVTKYGFKAGGNFSDVTFTGKSSADTRTGFVAGFFISYGINDKLVIQPELQYSSQGSKQLKLEYLQFPVMVKYDIIKKVNFQLGPQIGIKIHEFEDQVQNIDYGINIGLGLEVLENVEFDIRYSFGFAQIYDNVTTFNDSKHRYIQVTFAYTL
jgi:hypothetical protein